MTWLKSPKGTLLPTWSSQYVNTATVGNFFTCFLFIHFSKPPTIPKKSSNTTPSKSTPWRTASTERPASAMAMSPKTERTLQEIDRDINQIWQELQARIYQL